MKLLSQFIALYLPETNWLQVMATIGSAFIFLKMLLDGLSGRRRREIRRKNREIENNMWLIE